MKKILYYAAFTIATLSLSSCSDENEVVSENLNYPSDGKTLIANIVDPVSGDVTSRTNISSSFNFTWADGDVLGIFPDEGDQIYFKITKGAGTNTATFDGGGWALKKGHSYYSYYPFNRENFSSEDTKEAIPVSIEGQSIDGDNMFGHLGKNDPMFAQSENTTGSIVWDFQHLVSWLKLKVTLPVNCSISKIVLSNTDGLLHTTGTVDLTSSLPTITATNNLKEISIPCENVSVKANEETVIPVAIMPTNLSAKTISIKLFTDYFDYEFDLPITKKWLQGYFYSQELTNSDEIPTYKVTQAGTLPTLIGETRKFAIDKMKIIGNLNGNDIKFIREMAGVNVDGNRHGNGKLVSLDLSEANIVAGGDPYYSNTYGAGTFGTEANTIGERMFEYSGLNNIILPNTVTTIKMYAFAGSNVTTLNIPESVTDIQTMSLVVMPYLTEFTGKFASTSKRELIKDNTLVALAASGLSGQYTVPQGITTIGDGALAHLMIWSKLTSIVIPEGVTTIGNGAFWGSTVLQSITIPNSVKTIGYSAFGLCESLTSIVIPEGITSIEKQTFTGCKALTSFTIPNGVTSVGEEAFDNCVNLSSISIASSVKSIDSRAFRNSSITKISVTDLAAYCEFDATIFGNNYEGKNCLYVNDNLVTNLVIPNNVTKIGRAAFAYCSDIRSVTISNKVNSIGSNAFADCKGIESITIPDNVTIIDVAAFVRCENLEELVLGRGVQSIGNSSFYGCNKLSEITCHAINPPTVDTNSFGDRLKSKCYVPNGSKKAYEEAGWTDYFFEISELN